METEYKTVEEWYELLPEDVKIAALHYAKQTNNLAMLSHSMSDALSCGFTWKYTDEGPGYWVSIFTRYRELELNPIKEIEDDE